MNAIDWIGITLAGIGTIGNVSSLILCILLKELTSYGRQRNSSFSSVLLSMVLLDRWPYAYRGEFIYLE